jgi:rhamnogalacturonyl hydrolase YesR
MTPLDYARAACDTLMRRYAAPDLPPKPQFHYHQGVFLSGMHETWKLCKEEKYFQYMKDWIDSVFKPDGSIDEDAMRLVNYIHGKYHSVSDPLGFFGFSVASPRALERRGFGKEKKK